MYVFLSTTDTEFVDPIDHFMCGRETLPNGRTERKCTVLKRILGLVEGEVTVGWRKLLSEELHNLYSSFVGVIACSTY
jgi:hypothetical protein